MVGIIMLPSLHSTHIRVQPDNSASRWRLWLGAAWLLAVLGLVPLVYWLCLAWRQLGLAINLLLLGYGRLGLAMAVLGY